MGGYFKLGIMLLLVLHFMDRPSLELMYISLIVNIRSSLIHLHGFQLLVLPLHIEITSFVCSSLINRLNVKFRQSINCCKKGS